MFISTFAHDHIQAGQVAFEPEEAWGHVSHEAKALIQSMLRRDPAERM